VTNIIVYRYRSRFYNTVTYLSIIHPTEATGYHRLNDVMSRHSVSNNSAENDDLAAILSEMQ
jgi:hypothetical protein